MADTLSTAQAPRGRRDLAVPDDGRRLRLLATAVGLGSAVLFVAIAVGYELQAYADGSIFSYAVAVQDAWAFHWHNISGRLFVYLFCFVPAEAYVRLTGDAEGGVTLYGLLFYVAPLLGLIVTFVADRSPRRILFIYACVSTACLCPLVFGFPTEMWMAHAVFWPALALCHYAGLGLAGSVAVFAALLALAFTHGGGAVFAAVAVATVALRGLRSPAFLRALAALVAVLVVLEAVKTELPPDTYFGSILPAAARNFIDLTILCCPMSLLLFATLGGYAVVLLIVSRIAPTRAALHAAAITVAALAIYWLKFDHWLHAENRYYLRTALFAATPLLASAAAVHALRADGSLGSIATRLLHRIPPRGAALTARAFAGALLLIVLVHTVETGKFVVAWNAYKTAVEQLATGTTSDPALGDPRFVSSDRIASRLAPLAWSSTTQYLSVLLAPGFAPRRLVVDPSDDYFWIPCETAMANRRAARAIPAQSRELVGTYACLHRPHRVVLGPGTR